MRNHPGIWTAIATAIGLVVGVGSRLLLTRRHPRQFVLIEPNC